MKYMKLKNGKKKNKRKDLKYETKKCTYDFQKSDIRSSGEIIHTHTAKTVEVEESIQN